MPLTLRYSSCGMFLFSVACNVLFFAVCLPLKHLFTNDEGVFCFVFFLFPFRARRDPVEPFSDVRSSWNRISEASGIAPAALRVYDP